MRRLQDLERQDLRQIPGFPNYLVSFSGEVFTANREYAPLRQQVNREGVANVALYQEGRMYRRGVARLVADTFLEPPTFEHYDTPINKDGNRLNCHAVNLEWRPRWFAVEYHQQYWNPPNPSWGDFPVEVPRYREWYDHCFDFCMEYGALVRHVIDALIFAKPVPLLWLEVRSPTFGET